MRALLLIGLYLAAGLAFAIAVDADPENFTVVFFVTLAAALVVGWGTGDAGVARALALASPAVGHRGARPAVWRSQPDVQ
jgi:uncharacterized membrane protein YjjB (DUF3815 family)